VQTTQTGEALLGEFCAIGCEIETQTLEILKYFERATRSSDEQRYLTVLVFTKLWNLLEQLGKTSCEQVFRGKQQHSRVFNDGDVDAVICIRL
jgi:hypothetical protein